METKGNTWARLELAQYELWSRLGWLLTPHPDTPDGHRRDFLLEHPDHDSIYLECAVDLESTSHRKAERRWEVVEKALSSIRSPDHQLLIDRRAVGAAALQTRPICKQAQAVVDHLPPGRAGVILKVNQDGWQFTVEAMAMPSAGKPAVASGGGLSLEQRLYNPIRQRVVEKARRSSRLDKPFVVALLIDYPMPILSKEGVVQEALFGTTTVNLGPQWQRLGETNRGDGIWFDGTKFRRTGLSALLVQQGLWPGQQLPTLHVHPGAERPLDAALPLDMCRYTFDDRVCARNRRLRRQRPARSSASMTSGRDPRTTSRASTQFRLFRPPSSGRPAQSLLSLSGGPNA